MLDPAASRRITANLAVVYPSLPCGRVEPSIVPVRQAWQIPSAVYLLECDQISRFRLRWSCLGASIEPLAQSHIDAGLLVELAPGNIKAVPLFWTVSRLHAQALQAMTDAVKDVAKLHL